MFVYIINKCWFIYKLFYFITTIIYTIFRYKPTQIIYPL